MIVGLREGFDVGIREQLSRSYIFRQPCFVTIRPGLHHLVYSRGTGHRSLFSSLPPRGSRSTDRAISHFPSRFGTETSHGLFSMIQDMSYPRNHPSITSINHSINSDDFPTAWGIFDNTAALILSLPAGCLAATFDISAAYRLTPIRPNQQHHLCVFWKDMVYVDRAVMFGLSSSAGIFGSIGDMLIAIYRKAGFT